MTPRGRHLIEMRFALANNCSLPEAKRRLARQAALEARDAAALRSQCGTDYTARQAESRRQIHKSNPVLTGDAPWMLRD